ncbi:MAG: T9SS type A sorting domain-containing protein [Saprospiraceae bacterium]|nr:T9SS type A sorting domain-containing protein [Saprospiraceae bacterium]
MNLRLLSVTILSFLCALLAMGNKNGRASSAGKGNTGAPGDELSGGQPRTCLTCHNQGPITASLAISVLDSAGNAITKYHPGKQYTAQVKITASGTNLSGYGFQMIALKNSGNTDLDGFSDVNPNNYKIATISNGRTYAEHDNISASNTFNVKWTAPPAGTGNITFYAAGNGVNGNGTTSGDGAGINTLLLTESGTTTATDEQDNTFSGIKVFPNPVQTDANLWLGKLPGGVYQCGAYQADGKKVWENTFEQPEQGIALSIPSTEWAPGIYFIELRNEQRRGVVKIIKL